MFADFFKSIAQFDDPKFRLVVWRGLGLTLRSFDYSLYLDRYGLEPISSIRSSNGDYWRDILAGKSAQYWRRSIHLCPIYLADGPHCVCNYLIVF